MPESGQPSCDSLNEELEQLLKHIYTLHHTDVDLGLERVKRFLKDWGSPQDHLPPVIHIAGTNGKGSTLSYLKEMTQVGKHNVHRYTSPHLIKFNERINISGKDIDNEYLLHLIKEGLEINKNQPVSFFEFTTALAFKAFADTPADIVLLETGLGGRLDATNVVNKPDATIITPIGYDHMEFLGETLPQIAQEKAGIMKPDVPCIIAPQIDNNVYQVFANHAAANNVPLWLYGRDWRYEADDKGFTLYLESKKYHYPLPQMTGTHQIMNAAVAAVASHVSTVLKKLTDKERSEGITNAFWPARLQDISSFLDLPAGWNVVLDGGHNADCAAAIAHHIKEKNQKVHLIIGMLDNKDCHGFIKPLTPYIESISCVPIVSHKPTNPETLQKKLEKSGLSSRCFDTPFQALNGILSEEHAPGSILITGSLYLAGDVLSRIHGE